MLPRIGTFDGVHHSQFINFAISKNCSTRLKYGVAPFLLPLFTINNCHDLFSSNSIINTSLFRFAGFEKLSTLPEYFDTSVRTPKSMRRKILWQKYLISFSFHLTTLSDLQILVYSTCKNSIS